MHYREAYRPQYHFSPLTNWMNDPNGMVYFDGEYHLAYQYNPEGNRWGHMSWGHAVSADLVHWQELPLALPEDEENMIFSGSAVVDWTNSSGFGDLGNPPLVAIYTVQKQEPDKGQSQHIAYSLDRGRTWTKYAENPVLDECMHDFRDPKVFWYEPDACWIMVVALSKEFKIAFYGSKDLKQWHRLSTFESPDAALGIWECPDLFPLPVDGDPNNLRWVLIVSLGEGAVAGGSGSLYFIGNFDGEYFSVDSTAYEKSATPLYQWVDFGADFYAAVSWSDIPERDGRRVWLGWMNNWRYAQEIPTHPWRGSQSIPRRLELKSFSGSFRLSQYPVEELERLRDEHRIVENIALDNSSLSLANYCISGEMLEIATELAVDNAREVGVKIRVGNHEETVIGYDVRRQCLFVDRTSSGKVDFHPDFPSRREAPLTLKAGLLYLRIFVDKSSVEVFSGDGTIVLSQTIFPSPDSDGVSVYAVDGRASIKRIDAWSMRSIWR